MEVLSPNVVLLAVTPDAETLVAMSGRMCYSSTDVDGLKEQMTPSGTAKMINMLAESGHLSTFEHVNWTFAIEGVSRAFTHQWVRNRLMSTSQQSQRYVKETDFDYIIPRTIINKDRSEIFRERMKIIQGWYNEELAQGIPAEDARFYLPNAVETKLISTMNTRELLHILNLRLCKRAQWEYREVAKRILDICKNESPLLFSKAGPSCVTLGYCPEGDKTCGLINKK